MTAGSVALLAQLSVDADGSSIAVLHFKNGRNAIWIKLYPAGFCRRLLWRGGFQVDQPRDTVGIGCRVQGIAPDRQFQWPRRSSAAAHYRAGRARCFTKEFPKVSIHLCSAGTTDQN